MFWNAQRKKIYADCAAATPISKSVQKAMMPYWQDIFYNPHALYNDARQARGAVDTARDTAADLFHVPPRSIIFTQGATESNNLAIQGVIKKWRNQNPHKKPHIIISPVEHEAIFNQVMSLRDQDVLTYDILPLLPDGVVDISRLKELITHDTVLISCIYAQNELGTIQPIREITKTVRWWKKRNDASVYPLVHTDAVQAPLFCDMHIPRLGVDLLTASSAKIYGPKGIAILYSKYDTVIEPLIYGGGQEHGMRSGTENVPLIVGCAKALSDAITNQQENICHLKEVTEYMMEQLLEKIPDIRINGDREERLPHIVNISCQGIMSEELVLRLDADGIQCASQSACSTDKYEDSRIMYTLYPHENTTWGSIRFSFMLTITKRDIDYIIERLHYHVTAMNKTYQIFHE